MKTKNYQVFLFTKKLGQAIEESTPADFVQIQASGRRESYRVARQLAEDRKQVEGVEVGFLVQENGEDIYISSTVER